MEGSNDGHRLSGGSNTDAPLTAMKGARRKKGRSHLSLSLLRSYVRAKPRAIRNKTQSKPGGEVAALGLRLDDVRRGHLCIRPCGKWLPFQHRRKHDRRAPKSDRTAGGPGQAQGGLRARSCGCTTAPYHHHGWRDRDARGGGEVESRGKRAGVPATRADLPSIRERGNRIAE